MEPSSVTIVGTGYQVAGHLTLESRAAIEGADKLFYLVNDKVSETYLAELNASAESLADCYAEGRPGIDSSEEMVQRVVAALDHGRKVCVAFAGHPAVLLPPAHDVLRLARQHGHTAKMLPAVSAMGCLFAEIGLDPGIGGCAVFEATDFLVYHRQFDPNSPLILLQIGVIGLTNYVAQSPYCAERLAILAEVLMRVYPPDHEVIVYQAEVLPIGASVIHRAPLARLSEAPVTVISTLCVPPLGATAEDAEMRARIRDYFPPEADADVEIAPEPARKI